MIKLAIADDHQIVIDGLLHMLRGVQGISIVGTASDGGQLIALLQQSDANLALVDISMPNMNGIQACQKIRQDFSGIRVVALTMMNESSIIRKMLEAGASGYLMKNTGKDELIRALTTVNNGGTYYASEVAASILNTISTATTQAKDIPALSRREKQILKLIIDEMTTQEIADTLGIAFGTVETHRRNIMQKLNVRNVVGMVKFALEHNLLEE